MAKLKEFLKLAQGKEIQDSERVAQIVEQFADLTLEEICQASNPDYQGCCEVLLPSVNLSNDNLGKLSYTDMVSLTDNLYGSSYFVGDGYSLEYSLNFQFFQVEMFRRMLEDAKMLPTVQMFLQLSVNAFYEYLESRHQNRLAEEARELLLHKLESYIGYGFDKNITIQKVLQEVHRVKKEPWKPWSKKIKEYEKNVLQGYDIQVELLVRSFKTGFRERCRLENVISKYQEGEECDGEYFV